MKPVVAVLCVALAGFAPTAPFARDDSPREVLLEWFFATDLKAAATYLPATAQPELATLDLDRPTSSFNGSPRAEPSDPASARKALTPMLLMWLLPRTALEMGGGYRAQRVDTGNTLVRLTRTDGGPEVVITVDEEQIQKDRALLKLTADGDGKKIPLVAEFGKESGGWRLTHLDSPKWGGGIPRFDAPHLVNEFARFIADGLKAARISANEARAIGDVRTIISAEAAYSVNDGGYGKIACLSDPHRCLRSYPPNGPTFLDSGLTSLAPKSGYSRSFFEGPPSEAEGARSKAGAGSLKSWAYVAVPVEPGETGKRGFCGDDTGRVCATSDGSAPSVRQGRCGDPCLPLDGAPTAKAASTGPATTLASPVTVRVGGEIKEPRKITTISPVYPESARQARVQGVVILECTIDPGGKVANVRILRGIQLLDDPAIDAVKQWIYAPTLLHGAPVSVIMTVTVNFRLSAPPESAAPKR